MTKINGKTFSQYAELLRSEELSYNGKQKGCARRAAVSGLRTNRIKRYFRTNAGLDLDAMEKSPETAWEKALILAAFVAKNIPHDNQKEPLPRRNAITLWEYSRRVPTGFNCRWHAILLGELLLAVKIKSVFVTCLPNDPNDGDCHVVNQIWLPETGKWAMLDSDMTEYAVDEHGTPLSLREMREYVRTRRDFAIRALPGFEDSWIASEDGMVYMKCYWAKNLFWFARHTAIRYGLEGGFCPGDRYICLVPNGYHYNKQRFGGAETSDADAFWR